MTAEQISLSRDEWGRLALHLPDGSVCADVEPIRTFPWSAPESGIVFVDREGHEVWRVDQIDSLPPAVQQLLRSDLASREFVPAIERIERSSSPFPPTEWHVITDRGPTTIAVDSEDDVRQISSTAALVIDSSGVRYHIPDVRRLDSASLRHLRRLL